MISGELARIIAANAATSVLITARGGELIDTIAPIAIPAVIAIGAAASGMMYGSSATA